MGNLRLFTAIGYLDIMNEGRFNIHRIFARTKHFVCVCGGNWNYFSCECLWKKVNNRKDSCRRNHRCEMDVNNFGFVFAQRGNNSKQYQ